MTLTIDTENDRLRDPLLHALEDARLDRGDEEELRELVEDVLRLRSSLASLRPAMARIDATPPAIARVAQATENAWRAIEEEFGLLQSSEVARRLGSTSASNRTLARTYRESGRLLAVKRLNSFRFPGFQFDAEGVRPAIGPLIAVAAEAGWTQDDLILWLCAPSGTFGGDRPVDHLDDEDILDRVRDVAAVEW